MKDVEAKAPGWQCGRKSGKGVTGILKKKRGKEVIAKKETTSKIKIKGKKNGLQERGLWGEAFYGGGDKWPRKELRVEGKRGGVMGGGRT